MGITEHKAKKQQIRRENIIDAAERVFFTKGFATATMDDVAREVEFSKRTLYAYFSSKDQLYNAIILRAYQILNDLVDTVIAENQTQNGLVKIRAALHAFIRAIIEYPHYYRAIMDYQNRDEDFITDDEIIRACYQEGNVSTEKFLLLLKEGVADGSLKKELNIDGAYLLIYGQLLGFGALILNKAKYIKDYFGKPITVLVEETIELILIAIKEN